MTYEDYAKFQALREEIGEEKALKKAQTCNNTINWPLIQGPYDQKILGQTILFPGSYLKSIEALIIGRTKNRKAQR